MYMNKKLLVLLWVYASGVAAALLYNKKTPEQIETEMKNAQASGEKDIKVLFNNFIEIHQNLLDTLKARLLTDENKQKFYEKKDELVALAQDFRVKWESLVQEYKLKGKDYANEWVEKLEKFYHETLSDLDELKKKAPEKIEEAKSKVISYFDELKVRLKK